MAKDMQFVLFDPVSDTKVTWDMEGEERFGITLKNATGALIEAVARKTGLSPVQVAMQKMNRAVIRVEPKTKGKG